jgi:hypothetical protein
LQDNDAAKYWEFSRLNHELSKGVTLRGMLRFKKAPGGGILLDEVWGHSLGIFASVFHCSSGVRPCTQKLYAAFKFGTSRHHTVALNCIDP